MRNKTLAIGVVGIVIGLLLLSTAVVLAGSLDPSVGPADPGSQMYTLQQIYTRLSGGGDATKMTTFTEPSSVPGSTMHTLDEIYALALPARVPKTGAGDISGYTEDANEDGTLQKGVAWPNPRFITGTTGVVTDTLTGLIWLQNANCASLQRDWATAILTDVVSLNSAGTMNGNDCGDTSNGVSHQTDWRLPNVRELQSLVHYGSAVPRCPTRRERESGRRMVTPSPACSPPPIGRVRPRRRPAWLVDLTMAACSAIRPAPTMSGRCAADNDVSGLALRALWGDARGLRPLARRGKIRDVPIISIGRVCNERQATYT